MTTCDLKTKKLINMSIVKDFKLDYDKRMVLGEQMVHRHSALGLLSVV